MRIWVLFYLLILCIPVFGKERPRGRKIYYSRSVPQDVERLMPHGARSYFWGTFQLRKGGTTYGVRIIDPNWKKNLSTSQARENNLIYSDFFVFKGSNWQRIRHCILNCSLYISEQMRLEAEYMWLAPQKKSKPIFRFTFFGLNGSGTEKKWASSEGKTAFVTFPQGWKGIYGVQSFSVGYWRAADALGCDVLYGKMDKKGLCQIQTFESITDDGNPQRITTYS